MGGLYLMCWRRNYPQDRGTRPVVFDADHAHRLTFGGIPHLTLGRLLPMALLRRRVAILRGHGLSRILTLRGILLRLRRILAWRRRWALGHGQRGNETQRGQSTADRRCDRS
jgi:hypothetical protein